MKKIFILLIPYIVFSCNALPIPSVQKDASTSIELGSIGIMSSGLVQNRFQINAIPTLEQKIMVKSISKYFDKTTLSYYNKNQPDTTKTITYIDSLKIQPKYLQLEIIDKVTLLEELNAQPNKKVVDYLKTAENILFISSVSIKFPEMIQNNLQNAEEVYLVNSANKKYVLALFNKNKLSETIAFSTGDIFEYETSILCWGVSDRHNIVITDITNGKCGKSTYKTYYKAHKKQIKANQY